jgi:hypothetical protein
MLTMTVWVLPLVLNASVPVYVVPGVKLPGVAVTVMDCEPVRLLPEAGLVVSQLPPLEVTFSV